MISGDIIQFEREYLGWGLLEAKTHFVCDMGSLPKICFSRWNINLPATKKWPGVGVILNRFALYFFRRLVMHLSGTARIAINGLGRIGRQIVRLLVTDGNECLELAAVNQRPPKIAGLESSLFLFLFDWWYLGGWHDKLSLADQPCGLTHMICIASTCLRKNIICHRGTSLLKFQPLILKTSNRGNWTPKTSVLNFLNRQKVCLMFCHGQHNDFDFF